MQKCRSLVCMPRRILVVDDEADFQDLLRYHLSAPGCEVLVAGNFAAAMLVTQPPPDLILLDIMLPDVDGLTLCEALKARPALVRAPIWIVSAAHSDTTRELAYRYGASEFFAKPIDFTAFKRCFQAWLGSTKVESLPTT
jgi:DNA-binding response OmpR family regulator